MGNVPQTSAEIKPRCQAFAGDFNDPADGSSAEFWARYFRENDSQHAERELFGQVYSALGPHLQRELLQLVGCTATVGEIAVAISAEQKLERRHVRAIRRMQRTGIETLEGDEAFGIEVDRHLRPEIQRREADALEAIEEIILEEHARTEVVHALPFSYAMPLYRQIDPEARWIPRRPQVITAQLIEMRLRKGRSYRQLVDKLDAIASYAADFRLLSLDEDQIRDLAEEIANRNRREDAEDLRRWLEDNEGADPTTFPSRFAPRDLCKDAQKRHLRKRAQQADTHISWILRLTGIINRTTGEQRPFVAAHTLSLWQQRQAKAATFCAENVVVDDCGEVIGTISEIKSKAEDARRSTLFAMIKGFQEVGQRKGLSAFFFTLTLPGRYHPNPTHTARCYDPAISPADARAAMQACWHRAMALKAIHAPGAFGVWTAEAQLDGTPHRHGMIWCEAEEAEALRGALEAHFPGENALDWKEIDPNQFERDNPGRKGADPSTYILKYVFKALNQRVDSAGPEVEADHYRHWDRHRAWASALGARRFGLFGLQPGAVTLWKRIYNADADSLRPGSRLAKARKAMRKSQWASALALLGVLRPKSQRKISFTYREKVSRYGETYRVAVGCEAPGDEYTWKTKDYTIAAADNPHRESAARRSAAEYTQKCAGWTKYTQERAALERGDAPVLIADDGHIALVDNDPRGRGAPPMRPPAAPQTPPDRPPDAPAPPETPDNHPTKRVLKNPRRDGLRELCLYDTCTGEIERTWVLNPEDAAERAA